MSRRNDALRDAVTVTEENFALPEAAPTSITVLMEFRSGLLHRVSPEEDYSKVRDAFRTAKEACVLTPINRTLQSHEEVYFT
jgi:hypothetical protein